jgi:hypothetical protein
MFMPSRSRRATLMFAVVPALAIATSTLAQSAEPQSTAQEMREKVRAACAADVAKLCANIERAKGAMRSCMETHETQLSDGCKAARAERAAARAKEKG